MTSASEKRHRKILRLLRSIPKETWIVTGILLLGIILRAAYLAATPLDVRGHDVEGHVEYIDYVANTLSIPPTTEGWEFYQPPLYYFFFGLYYRFGEVLQIPRQELLKYIQYDSLVLSIATLLLSLWIGRLLFARKNRNLEFYLFGVFIAVFPGLIYLAARINNDVLYTFFAFFFLAMLLEWWFNEEWRDWYLCCIVITLGIVTKTNAFLFLPIAFTCLLFKRGVSFKKKIAHGSGAVVMMLLLAGWLPVYRLVVDKNAADESDQPAPVSHIIVPNLTNLNDALLVKNNLAAYLVFNPIEIIRIPFHNPWEDVSRRNFFWETLFKSSISGEFDMGERLKWAASQVLLSLLLLLPFGIIGFFMVLWKEFYKFLPMTLTFGATLAGHAIFRYMSPFSSTQDFRYSPLLVVCLVFFILYGLEKVPNVFRAAGLLFYGAFCYLSAQYILSIVLLHVR